MKIHIVLLFASLFCVACSSPKTYQREGSRHTVLDSEEDAVYVSERMVASFVRDEIEKQIAPNLPEGEGQVRIVTSADSWRAGADVQEQLGEIEKDDEKANDWNLVIAIYATLQERAKPRNYVVHGYRILLKGNFEHSEAIEYINKIQVTVEEVMKISHNRR